MDKVWIGEARVTITDPERTLLEHQGVEPSKLGRLAALPIKGYRTLDPTGSRKGPRNRHWMIQENLPGKVKA
jgi:hypothetical protein